MGKPSIGVLLFGWLEAATAISIIAVLLRIEYYPMILLFIAPFVTLLGIFTLLLRPMARNFNLLLSPLIVLAYVSNLMIIIENIVLLLGLSIQLKEAYFYLLFIPFLIVHIFFFRHPKVKEQFGL